MRLLRLFLVLVLGVALIGLAIANRGLVSVNLLPASVSSWLGGSWSVKAPMFLVILLALLIGMVLGMLWEWLRESPLRAESGRRAQQLTDLERETGHLRKTFSAPKDEVLAILDAPKPDSAARAPAQPPSGNVPALR